MVSEPAKAMDTAIVMTRESFINSGRSIFAWINLESRSGFIADFGSVDGKIESTGFEGKRSAMRF